MRKLMLPLVVLFALGLAGCDKKPTDPPKPKTTAGLTQPSA